MLARYSPRRAILVPDVLGCCLVVRVRAVGRGGSGVDGHVDASDVGSRGHMQEPARHEQLVLRVHE